jgi:hypothetical protein
LRSHRKKWSTITKQRDKFKILIIQGDGKAEIAENKFLDVRKEPDPIKFYEFAKEYLQWSKVNKKPLSFNRDLSSMKSLNEEFEAKSIQEITPWQIEKYKAKKRKRSKLHP